MATGIEINTAVLPVPGIRLAAIPAGIRYQNRLDLVLVELDAGATVAGVFTRNAFCAAPVVVARMHLQQAACRYLLINTGNANAGTGAKGQADAEACCEALAGLTGIDPRQVLPFSTGVIGEPLPVATIIKGLPAALQALDADRWATAARGIMTTDTRPKAVSGTVQCGDKLVTITGIAKGAGMIKPNMATMLAFIGTDAVIEPAQLQSLLSDAVSHSFNRITVDGDTSTNDSCILMASGRSGVTLAGGALQAFAAELNRVCSELAMAIIRDAEGATKFVTIRVVNGGTSRECLAVAYAIAESPLVKTALFASDPNWGRILAAIGRAEVTDLDIGHIAVTLGNTPLVVDGALASSYTEAQGQLEMNKEDIDITVDLRRGAVAETVWTSDLSLDYVRINADYRS
ncbi:MAG: hypothetical protein RLZZ385_884 [Pseudomonadota bacterium]|jgi:glutamate N-acetyltransferase/amino-acid N-acetyltransferase